MLIQFSVRNYRSIKDTVTLDFVAQKRKSQDSRIDKNNVANIKNVNLLKSIGIYGANASGKTNIIKALKLFDRLINTSASKMQKGDEIDVEPFLLDSDSSSQPTLFELVFLYEGIKYRYGFEASRKEVIEEWLYWTPKSHERRVFTRQSGKIIKGEDFPEADQIQKLVRSNALFLSVAAQFNAEIPSKVTESFSTMFFLDGAEISTRGISVNMLESSFFKDDIIKFLKSADLCIDNITLGDKSELSEFDKELVNNGAPEDMLVATNRVVNIWHNKTDREGNIISREKFDLDKHESNGTKKLFALSALLIATLKFGGVLIIDEIDSQLHPIITLTIIRLFNSIDNNPKNAQLLFVTHDTNILDSKVLRRDQIWFAEKNSKECTDFYSLADYKVGNSKVRNDASYEKSYISGKYGAIPYLGVFDFNKDSDV